MADAKRRFYAEPGTVVSFNAGPDSRACEYSFDDSGVLELNADDQEPVSIIQEDFVASSSQPISEKPSERKASAVQDFSRKASE